MVLYIAIQGRANFVRVTRDLEHSSPNVNESSIWPGCLDKQSRIPAVQQRQRRRSGRLSGQPDIWQQGNQRHSMVIVQHMVVIEHVTIGIWFIR